MLYFYRNLIIIYIGCEDGSYGTNCQDRCGQCKTNVVCDRYNGTCHDGCQIWWTDTKCNTYIGRYVIYEYNQY